MCVQEFRADLLNVLAKAWMLGMLCFAWGVGISRCVWAPLPGFAQPACPAHTVALPPSLPDISFARSDNANSSCFQRA